MSFDLHETPTVNDDAADASSSTSTVPPTFDELPPEQGSILELRSLKKESYNGMKGEFLKIDSSSDRFAVAVYDLNNKVLALKPGNCCRPTLLPLSRRVELYKQAKQYTQQPSKLREILKEDPCCVPAHMGLGQARTSQEANMTALQHFRRAVANFYAYETLLHKKDMPIICIKIAVYFGQMGQREELEVWCRRSLSKDPTQVYANYVLARNLNMDVCRAHGFQNSDPQLGNMIASGALDLTVEESDKLEEAMERFSLAVEHLEPDMPSRQKKNVQQAAEHNIFQYLSMMLRKNCCPPCVNRNGDGFIYNDIENKKTSCQRMVHLSDRFLGLPHLQNTNSLFLVEVTTYKAAALGLLSTLSYTNSDDNGCENSDDIWDKSKSFFLKARSTPGARPQSKKVAIYTQALVTEIRGDIMMSSIKTKEKGKAFYKQAVALLKIAQAIVHHDDMESAIHRVQAKVDGAMAGFIPPQSK